MPSYPVARARHRPQLLLPRFSPSAAARRSPRLSSASALDALSPLYFLNCSFSSSSARSCINMSLSLSNSSISRNILASSASTSDDATCSTLIFGSFAGALSLIVPNASRARISLFNAVISSQRRTSGQGVASSRRRQHHAQFRLESLNSARRRSISTLHSNRAVRSSPRPRASS